MTAEDLFQETLIRVWNGFKTYNEKNKFSSWLFSIAHNTAIDLLRSPVSKYTGQSLESAIINTNKDNPHHTLVAKETSELVMSAVNELSEKQKEVFLLRQHSGMTFKEIAETTNQPLNTVLGHMHYAVSKIRKKMSKEYE
jgi:RNA polymerase sigma-70 factor (ECF subfamily)